MYKILTAKDNMNETFVRIENYREQTEISQEYYPIPQSDSTIAICQGIMKLKDGVIDELTGSKIEVLLDNETKIQFEIQSNSTPQNLRFTDLDRVKSVIRASQVQLFKYILYQFNMEKSKKLKIDISDYFNTKGIKRRKENMDRFFEDLAILLGLNIEMNTNARGEIQRIMGKVITFQGYLYSRSNEYSFDFISSKKMNYVIIELGSWVEKLKLQQFVLIGSSLFTSNSKREWISIMLSIKFGQLLRTNINRLKANGHYNCKVKTIFKFLNINECEIKKQGTKYYYNLLQNNLETLNNEGYEFKIDICNLGYKEFMESRIYYSNEYLLSKYGTIKKKLL